MSFRLMAGLSSFGGSITAVGSAGTVGVGGSVGPFSLSGGIGFAGAGVTVAEVEATRLCLHGGWFRWRVFKTELD